LAQPWRCDIFRTRPAHSDDPEVDGTSVDRFGEKFNSETAWSPTNATTYHVPNMYGYLFLEVFGGKKP
jgi:hypothetical protein